MAYWTPFHDIKLHVLKSVSSLVDTFFPLTPPVYSKSLLNQKKKLLVEHPNSLNIHVLASKDGYFGVVHYPDYTDICFIELNTRRKSLHIHRFSSSEVVRLRRIPTCCYITGVGKPCNYCPRCLAIRGRDKVTHRIEKDIRRIERELKLLVHPKGSLMNTRRHLLWAKGQGKSKHTITMLRKRMNWLKNAVADPVPMRQEREDKLKELMSSTRRLQVKDRSKLTQLTHNFISFSLPDKWLSIFEVNDELFPVRTWRVNSGDADVLDAVNLITGKKTETPMKEIARDLLVRLIDREMRKLSSFQVHWVRQVHPHGLYQETPDFHYLVCPWAGDENGVERVDMNQEKAMTAFQNAIVLWLRTLLVLGASWASGTTRRREGYKQWRQCIRNSESEVLRNGLPGDCADKKSVPGKDLLAVQRYMRRMPMGMLRGMFFEIGKDTDTVKATFFKKSGNRTAKPKPVDFLKRLAGADGHQRSLQVSYEGLYALKAGNARRGALTGFLRAVRTASKASIGKRRKLPCC